MVLKQATAPSAMQARTGLAMAAARGAAIIMVVLFHTDIILGGVFDAYQPFRTTLLVLKYIAMPTFFLTVGIATSTSIRHGNPLYTINKRLVNYLYLYGLWVTISLAVSCFVVQMNIFPPATIFSLVKTYLLPGNPLWFLYCLVILMGSLPVILRLNRRGQLCFAVLLSQLPWLLHINRWEIDAVAHNAFLFYVGLVFRVEIMQVLRRMPVMVCAVGIPAYLVLLLGAVLLHALQWPFVDEILSAVAVLAAIAFWMVCPLGKFVSFMAWIGRAALPIYLLHDLWIHIMLTGLRGQPIAFANPVIDYAVPAGIAAVAIVVSMMVKVATKRMPGLFAVLPAAFFFLCPRTYRILQAMAVMPIPFCPALNLGRSAVIAEGPAIVGGEPEITAIS